MHSTRRLQYTVEGYGTLTQQERKFYEDNGAALGEAVWSVGFRAYASLARRFHRRQEAGEDR